MFLGGALIVSFFIKKADLSTEHTETRTGLREKPELTGATVDSADVA